MRSVLRPFGAEMTSVWRIGYSYLRVLASALIAIIAKQMVDRTEAAGEGTIPGYPAVALNLLSTLVVRVFSVNFRANFAATRSVRVAIRAEVNHRRCGAFTRRAQMIATNWHQAKVYSTMGAGLGSIVICAAISYTYFTQCNLNL